MDEKLAELQERAERLTGAAEREAARCTELSIERDRLDARLRELSTAETPPVREGVLFEWMGRGFETAVWWPVVIPIAIVVVAISGALTGDGPPTTKLSATVLDAVGGDVAVGERCTVVVVGQHRTGAACHGSIVCSGRSLLEAPLACLQDHRFDGTGDDATDVYTLRATGTASGDAVTIDVDDAVTTVRGPGRALTLVHDEEVTESSAER